AHDLETADAVGAIGALVAWRTRRAVLVPAHKRLVAATGLTFIHQPQVALVVRDPEQQAVRLGVTTPESAGPGRNRRERDAPESGGAQNHRQQFVWRGPPEPRKSSTNH